MSDSWDYRVVRKTTEDDTNLFSVEEVYYDDDGETPTAHTIDLQVSGDSITDLRKQIQRMLWCLDKEVVDEIKTETVTSVEREYEGPEYLNKKWIYESPDGGKTVFRRPFGDYDMKKKEEINWETKEPTGRKFTDYPF